MNDELTSKERAIFYRLYLQAFQKVDDERTRAAFWPDLTMRRFIAQP